MVFRRRVAGVPDTPAGVRADPTLTEVLLRRRRSVVRLSVDPSTVSAQEARAVALVGSVAANLQPLGWVLSPEVVRDWRCAPADDVAKAGVELLAAARELVGAHVRHQPMYPDFPRQVMDLAEAELYLNAYVHYLGDLVGARIVPLYEGHPRRTLDAGSVRVRPLALAAGSRSEVIGDLAGDLMRAMSGMSATDRSDLRVLLATDATAVAQSVPDLVSLRENAATVAALLERAGLLDDGWFAANVRSATDALRVAAALSGGDPSLAEPTRFASFPRSTRRRLLGVIDRAPHPHEELGARAEMFKRLGERLHPGEWTRFPHAADAFAALRNGRLEQSFHSRVEAALAAHDLGTAVTVLQQRPGLYVRRLDELLRHAVRSGPDQVDLVMGGLRRVAPSAGVRVLLAARGHLAARDGSRSHRAFFPKGQVSKVRSVPNTLAPLPADLTARAVAVLDDALVSVFSSRPPLGRVFVDQELRRYAVPLSTRAAPRALRTAGRGSTLPLPSGGVVRFFIWWQDTSGQTDGERVDLDLSAVAFTDGFEESSHVNYERLRSMGMTHSGDLTSAPDGAAEFIDVELDIATRAGWRYVAMVVTSYTRQRFVTLPGCFAGVMGRAEAQSGEIFEPATVEDRFDLSADSTIVVPLVLDLHERAVIWADLSVSARLARSISTTENDGSLTAAVRAVTQLSPPTMYDLMVAHARARGSLVDDRARADVVAAVDGDVSPLDVTTVLSDYL